jgi:RND family efflux transporter MFP subunit
MHLLRSTVRRMRARLLLGVAAVLVGVAVAVIATWVSQRRAIAAIVPQTAPSLTVTSAMPRKTDWDITLSAAGVVAPWQEASISAQVGGYRLIDVLANVGDRVRKGQVLARLDPALLRADEAQLRAGYEQADANRKRALSLKGSGGISEQDLLQYVTQANTTGAALDAKRLQLRYTEVLAPDDGPITARSATLGAVVPIGQELFRLIRQNRLEWRGELTAGELARVRIGQRVEVRLPDGGRAGGTVRQIAPSLDPQSRLGLVYVDLAVGSGARAGMYAEGRIFVGSADALVIPAESAVVRDGRHYVFTLGLDRAPAKVTRVEVEVGRHDGGDLEILAGIGPNERVVVQGAGFLNDGDRVRVADAPPAAVSRLSPSSRVP